MSEPPNAERPLLYCKELNAQHGHPTILLIHGAFGSGDGWDLVAPHLSETYHLLIPDLPGHGNSKDISPYSREAATNLLADLIRERALNGRAHIIGLSLGSKVAIQLASKHHEVVNSVFVSGYEVFASSQMLAYGLWLDNRLSSLAPKSVTRWLLDGTDIQTSHSPPTLAMCRAVAGEHSTTNDAWPVPWPARTLVVAAGKSGILPTADHPQDAIKLRDIGRQLNAETKAYTHPRMRHPWSRQDPKLFAETARMWFEEGGVPEEFVEL